MKLNSISVGGGLALVAVALLANSAASLLGSPDKVAHADELRRAAKSQPVADASVSRGDESASSQTMSMGSGTWCPVDREPQSWFGAIRLIPNCGPAGTPLLAGAAIDFADVDGDGSAERFRRPSESQSEVMTGGGTPGPCQVWHETYSFDDEHFARERSCVLSSEQLVTWLQSNTTVYTVVISGSQLLRWTDVDGDRDLDLVVVLHTDGPTLTLWLENTGFEKQTFAAGDINQDGEVDGVDISILLSDWTY